MLHSKKKRGQEPKERKKRESAKGQEKKRRVKAQSANVCQRHSVKRKERKHKVLEKKE